jgi:hypothetical protein
MEEEDQQEESHIDPSLKFGISTPSLRGMMVYLEYEKTTHADEATLTISYS